MNRAQRPVLWPIDRRWEAGQRLAKKLLLELYAAAAAGGGAHNAQVMRGKEASGVWELHITAAD